jgi:sulfatase modifying factor 1
MPMNLKNVTKSLPYGRRFVLAYVILGLLIILLGNIPPLNAETGTDPVASAALSPETSPLVIAPQSEPSPEPLVTVVPTPPCLLDMKPVPAGSFRMGNATTGDQNERPVHAVNLTAFFISATEITRGQYKALGLVPGKIGQDDQPVTAVSWLDAVKFCNALSDKENLDPVYAIKGKLVTADFSKTGYRLPTEAEWEYAARGAGQEKFNYAGGDKPNEVSWYDENTGHKIQDVAQKQANSLGLFDMSGNVWEWCWDYFVAYSSKELTDPVGPNPTKNQPGRIIRGGSFNFNDSSSRTGFRMARDPEGKYADVGFRVVRR